MSGEETENGNGGAAQKPADEAKAGAESPEELKDRLLRLAAEFDNYRKKTRKDMDSAKMLGKAELVKNLLPVLDEFEVAMMAMENAKNDGIAKGVEMLYSNLIEALRKDGLREVPAKGVFDPYKHEVIMAIESEKPAGTILEVVKKGYTLNDILLRPPAVIVAKGPTEAKKDGDGEKAMH